MKEDWERRFDQEFHFSDGANEINIDGSRLARDLKAFIRDLLANRLQ